MLYYHFCCYCYLKYGLLLELIWLCLSCCFVTLLYYNFLLIRQIERFVLNAKQGALVSLYIGFSFLIKVVFNIISSQQALLSLILFYTNLIKSRAKTR